MRTTGALRPALQGIHDTPPGLRRKELVSAARAYQSDRWSFLTAVLSKVNILRGGHIRGEGKKTRSRQVSYIAGGGSFSSMVSIRNI